jgi:uncharacterized protein
MKLVFDSSALVKRYLDERGRDAVQRLLAQATQVAVAAHCKTEILSAIARNVHDGAMGHQEVQRLLQLLQAVEAQTLQLLLQHRLRTIDALHVAAAQQAGADLFITADQRQAQAAQAAGLKTQLIEA